MFRYKYGIVDVRIDIVLHSLLILHPRITTNQPIINYVCASHRVPL